MNDRIQIKDLDDGVVSNDDFVIFQLAVAPYTVYKTTKLALKGDKGDTGDPATATVGTTTTLAPGSSATVVNSGTIYNAIFDFGIPQGLKGDTGEIGMDWQGAYNALTAYHINDGVSYLGSSYICIQAATGETPDVPGSLYWNLIAAKGSDGTGSGDVSKVGTPVDNQIAVWTGDGTIEGDIGLTYDKSTGALTLADGKRLNFGDSTCSILGNKTGSYFNFTSGAGGLILKASDFLDGSLNELLRLSRPGASAVNFLEIKNSNTLSPVEINALGDDTNIGILLTTKGNGVVKTSGVLETVGNIELGHASDTTLSRVSAGVIAVEGVTIPTISSTSTLSNKSISGALTLEENASIALDPAGSADGKWSGITVAGTAGYSQSFGDLVYLDPTDSRWEATDANSAAGADGDARGILGMVVSAGTDGNACTILLHGIIRADAKFDTFTINNPIYVSETAGAVTQTQPTTADVVIRFVGSALTADEMYFNPDRVWYTHV